MRKVLLFYISLALLFCISSCIEEETTGNNNIEFTVFTQYISDYPKLNDELIELALPFQNEETKNKFFSKVFVQRIDLNIDKQEIKGEVKGIGLKLKIYNLRKKYKKVYKNFRLPESFAQQSNLDAIAKENYLKKIQTTGIDTTIIFLLGKNKSWEFLKGINNIIILNVPDVQSFQREISKIHNKYTNVSFTIIYNVKFILEDNQNVSEKTKLDNIIETLDLLEKEKEDLKDLIAKLEKNREGSQGTNESKKHDKYLNNIKSKLKEKEKHIEILQKEIEKIQEDLIKEQGEHTKTKEDLRKEKQQSIYLRDTVLKNAMDSIRHAKQKIQQKDEEITKSRQSEIENLLDRANEDTKHIRLEGSNLTIYNLTLNDKERKVRGLNKKKYNQYRIKYKKGLKYYQKAYNISKNNENIQLEKILEEAEKKRIIYYKLLEKSGQEDVIYNKIEEFLEAL